MCAVPECPRAPDLRPYARVGVDVADVVRAATVLGDEPKGVTVEPVSDRGRAGLAGLAPGRLEERVARRREPQGNGCFDDRLTRYLPARW